MLLLVLSTLLYWYIDSRLTMAMLYNIDRLKKMLYNIATVEKIASFHFVHYPVTFFKMPPSCYFLIKMFFDKTKGTLERHIVKESSV